MQTATQRAVDIARNWYAGGSQENSEDDLRRMNGLAKIVEQALKEQDKLTRHAIAQALSVAAEMVTFEGADNSEYPMIHEELAHNIAMNTRAV